jgi:hypothetical protein
MKMKQPSGISNTKVKKKKQMPDAPAKFQGVLHRVWRPAYSQKLNISLYLLNASELSYPLFNHSTLHPKLTPDSGVLGPRQEGTGD